MQESVVTSAFVHWLAIPGDLNADAGLILGVIAQLEH